MKPNWKNIGKMIASFKDYRFNGILFKNFRLILLILVVPIFILNGAIYLFNIRIIEQEMTNNNHNTAIKLKDQLDNYIKDSRYAAVKIASNIDVLKYSQNGWLSRDYASIAVLDSIQKQIKNTINTSEAVQDILISFGNKAYMVGADSSWTNTGNLFTRQMPAELFDEGFPDGNHYLVSGGYLYFKNDIRSFGKYMGTVVAKAGIFRLASAANEVLQTPDSWMIIVDRSGKVMIDSHKTFTGKSVNEIPGMEEFLSRNASSGFIRQDGIQNVVSTIKSGAEEWHYILFTPAGSYQQRIQGLGIVLAVLILASLFITLLASWLVTYKLYRPIQIITEVLNNNSQNMQNLDMADCKKLDEVGFISNGIRFTQQQNFIIKTELDMKNELLKNAQSVALQAQINPHFLNNTLESINWKALEFFGGKQNDISLMLGDLSRLLKVSLDSRSFIVEIEKELEHARLYLRLQSYRFRNKLDIKWDIDETLLAYKTIKLSLQPLIENAIAHGIKNIAGTGIIGIACRSKEDRIEFVVTDNGRGMSPESLSIIKRKLDESVLADPEHLGLANINQRVKLYFGFDYGIGIESEPNQGTKVTLTIPKVK